MDIFKHFGIDMNNDTLSQIIDKMNDKGVGNFCITPSTDDNTPKGMFLVLSDPEAVPYVQRALEEYDADMEQEDAAGEEAI